MLFDDRPGESETEAGAGTPVELLGAPVDHLEHLLPFDGRHAGFGAQHLGVGLNTEPFST
ncbi:hypothetical protein [Actinoplanes philippinensis]|uniref:hypothetical protein n=1 Tax=Actinoplanes philippinensis TaxID=35752 RepID=UPI0033FE56CB